MDSKKKNEKYRITIHGTVEEINSYNETDTAKDPNMEVKRVSSFCSKCGWEIAKVEHYCSNCGTTIKKESEKDKPADYKRTFLKAAGLLTILSASMCWAIGLFSLHYSYGDPITSPVLFAGIFSFFALGLGLTAGILIFLKKLFYLTIIGIMVLIFASMLSYLVHYGIFLVFGLSLLILAIISLVFTVISRTEFTS